MVYQEEEEEKKTYLNILDAHETIFFFSNVLRCEKQKTEFFF